MATSELTVRKLDDILHKGKHRGVRYSVTVKGRKAVLTYWGSFHAPRPYRRHKKERFFIFRFEPARFPRLKQQR